MNIRMIKRKCGVRGCRELVSFAVSRTGEMGNSVIICKKCLDEAAAMARDFKMPEKPEKKSGVPGLFYNRVPEPVEKVIEEVPAEKPKRKKKKAPEDEGV